MRWTAEGEEAQTKRHWKRAILPVAIVALIAVGYPPAISLLIGAVVGVSVERFWWRHRQPVFRPGWRTDAMHYLFSLALQGIGLAISAGITAWLLQGLVIDASRDWLAEQPMVVQGLLGLVAFDFGYYWQHRTAHRWPLLWRFHAVHHSSERLDWLAAGRLHPVEALIGGFIIAPPVVLLGFSLESLLVFSSFTSAWAAFIHANVRWRLRWLDRLYPNPEYHHWHHADEPDAYDKNFGLPLWDKVFGTYFMPADRRPSAYGIGEYMPGGYFSQLAWPFRRRPPTQAETLATSEHPAV